MIERSKTNAKYSRRDRAARVNKKRRLTMEGLEARQLLAAEIYLPNVNLDTYDGPRNVGAVQALQMSEREQLTESGENDVIGTAQIIPLGNGPGQNDTIDLRGAMQYQTFSSNPGSFSVDIDTFGFDLKAGDILDISAFGTAGTIDLFYGNGTYWFGTEQVNGVYLPPDSPIQTIGNATASAVIPEDGRYYLTVTPIDTTSNYTLGLRTYRPIAEQLPVGVGQVVFLDFDGGFYPNSLFNPPDPATGAPAPGIVRVPSLQESLGNLGIEVQDTAALNRIIDQSIEEMERQFAYLGLNANAGDYDSTGIKGEFGITILNSRDHADPGSHPLVTRVLAGGGPVNPYGVSSTIDVGNFSMDDLVIAEILPPPTLPLSPTVSSLDYTANFLGFLMSHEVGHSFGLYHTDSTNLTYSTTDAGGGIYNPGGLDGIWGTLDDEPYNFLDDYYGDDTGSGGEGIFGTNRVTNGLANTLVTGLVGGTVAGTVFSDFNRDGSMIGDAGLPGFKVFADLNANGQRDEGEPMTLSDTLGHYSIDVRSGTFNIVAEGLDGFAATTNPTRSTTITNGQTSVVNFGFAEIFANITGTAFLDSNGNGVADSSEGGLEGVYIYADLDGDNRPDLGEPGAVTGVDGTYRINFPGPGTYTLRSDLDPGYERTFPASGEHTFEYDGLSLPDNYNFGFLPSLDFGDAPDSYGTTVDADGARHGITDGLHIGASVDREADGFPTATATGDDFDNANDEDGVRLLSPLAPGATATFEVTATNTTNSNAYLQGFLDFNRDGIFGVGEQFATNVPVFAGSIDATHLITVNVPDGVDPGASFVRFRLSQSSSIGATGFAETGEVEDHEVQIYTSANIANDDQFSVGRNSLSNALPVLENDFQTVENPLTIISVNTTSTAGVVVNNGDMLFYTPPNGFVGRDFLSYTVRDSAGELHSANVAVNVTFQSNVPIAVDDIFGVPQGSSDRALNVLDNDVASVFGGLSITSVTGGTEGGVLNIVSGGQSVRYTPAAGFSGTEQFTYSIQDIAGSVSTATITVNLLPASLSDDIVEFSIEVLDALNRDREVTNVQVGDEVLVRVSVDDLRLFAFPQPGLASAFIDLLYTDQLLSPVSDSSNSSLPFDISFGSLFSALQTGDATVPGLINEVGGVQSITNQQGHAGPVELFTIRLQAVSPGVAIFKTDPADAETSETVLLGADVALTPNQLRLGTAELVISPASDNFTSALDDSFPTGYDSDDNLISSNSQAANRLDVLQNDNLGPTGIIREFGILTNPSLGSVTINDNGTPSNLNDDYIDYFANQNENGLDSFTYVIVTDDNVRSIAEVTLALGDQTSQARVSYDFTLVSGDGSGTPISGVEVGDRFGVEVRAADLTPFTANFVYAGYLDVLYDKAMIAPADTPAYAADEFDFDVDFHGLYSADAAVGTAANPGIIDEFGTVWSRADSAGSSNPSLIATIYFNAISAEGDVARVVGSPADASPFQDTLLFGDDNPIDRSLLKFAELEIPITTNATPLQNSSFQFDVNADGFVSPIDALLVINQVNRESATGEGEQLSSNGKRYYTDVNGDNRTTALDALQVINYLRNASSSRGSGEQIALLSDSSNSPSTDQSSDAFFAELAGNSDGKIASFDSATSGNSSSSSTAEDDYSSANDDDIYSVLADDVDGRWS